MTHPEILRMERTGLRPFETIRTDIDECEICGDTMTEFECNTYAICFYCAKKEAMKNFTHGKGMLFIQSDAEFEKGFYLEFLQGIDTRGMTQSDVERKTDIAKRLLKAFRLGYIDTCLGNITTYEEYEEQVKIFCFEECTDEYTYWCNDVIISADTVADVEFYENINTNEHVKKIV